MAGRWFTRLGLAVVVTACGSPNTGETDEPRIGTVQEAVVNSISANPNPCTPAVGGSTCSATITWNISNTSLTYQVAARVENGPWTFLACTPPNSGSTASAAAPPITLHKTTHFSLRTTTLACSGTTLDAAATEVAVTDVEAASASVKATPELVVTPSLGSTTVDWSEKYGSGSYVVWTRIDDELDANGFPVYGATNCAPDGGTGSSGSISAPWIQAGHSYRFSLNVHPAGCASFPAGCSANPRVDCRPDGPEIAAATVKGVAHHVTATPSSCSAAAGSTCQTTVTWGMSTTGVTPQLWEGDGTTWTKLPCPTASQITRTLTAGKTYTYELHLPTSCGALRTSTTAASTTSVNALSGLMVRQGTGLKLDGQTFKSMGMNKHDLLLQYVSNPAGGGTNLPCSDPTGPGSASRQTYAESAIGDLAANGIGFARVFGAGFTKGDLYLWKPSNNCQSKYWEKFDRMLSDAAAVDTDPNKPGVQGLKLLVSILGGQFCVFKSVVTDDNQDVVGSRCRDNTSALLRDPNGCNYLLDHPPAPDTAKALMCRYAHDVVTRYAGNSKILAWELANETNLFVDVDLNGNGVVDSYEPTADDMVRFMRDLATAIKVGDATHPPWDAKHVLTSGNSNPRESAAHLRARPQNDPWTTDDQNMFESFSRYITPDPIDLFSVHVYNGVGDTYTTAFPDNLNVNTLFGNPGKYNPRILTAHKRAADLAGKPLYVGEYNDNWYCNTSPCVDPDNRPEPAADWRWNFTRAMAHEITELHLPLSSQWTWEEDAVLDGFVPGICPSTDASCPTGGASSDEPQKADQYVAVFKKLKGIFDGTTASMDVSPVNPGFDANSSGSPNQWSAFGGGSVVSNDPSHFSLNYARLQPPTNGAAVALISYTLYVNGPIPAGAKLVATIATRTHGSIYSYMQIFAYDASFNTVGSVESFPVEDGEPDPDVFRIRLAHDTANVNQPYATLPASTRSIAVALYGMGPTDSYVDYDDVHVTIAY